MPLTHDDVKKIIAIIDGAEHLQEVELGWGDFQLHVWRGGDVARPGMPATPARLVVASAGNAHAREPVTAAATLPPVTAGVETDLNLAEGEVVIRAPMLGTFYRAASPGDKPFVDIGQRVGAGDTVCIIEVMKLFNSIRAGVDGTVTRILHTNATLVEFNQPLMVIAATSAAAG
jgi:acetyl-CoA carboxylase biotin carboxyl carrier protein